MKHTMSSEQNQYEKHNIGEKSTLLPEQCRAARAMLGWSRKQLASAAEVAVGTVIDFERGARQPYKRTLSDLRRAFESSGIVFLEANEDGPGLRQRRSRDH